jgi:AcrR family transcriptional regulator
MSQDNATPGVGGPRSEATRRSILEAARATFATRGYEQTTIRAVAAQAGIDPSMVMRYFGSKAGLFTAASTIDLHPPELAAVPARRRGEHLVRHFVDRWEASSTDETLVFMMRTAVTNDAVANQMQATFDALILEPITALDDHDAGERAALIGSQMLGLVLCRYVLRLEPMVSLPVDDIVAGVAPTIQRYLTRPPTR